jgi:hypothetical protein
MASPQEDRLTMTAASLTHSNGVTRPALPPLQLLQRGPVSPYPRAGTDATPVAGTEAGGTAPPTSVPEGRLHRSALAALSRLRAPSGDTVITWAMAATVALVAVDAAIVSYSHIYGLASGQWGSGAETGVQARLLPLSIDGVIAEASLVKLYAARHKTGRKPRLATFMLWLGIVATVAANVTHGLPSPLLPPVAHTVILALLSAWPAGAFIGSVEMAMGLVRDKRAVASTDDTDSDTEGDSDSDTETPGNAGQGGGGGDSDRDTKPDPRRRRRTQPDPVTAAIKRGWDDDKIVAKLGVTKRTIQRRRKDLEKAGGAPAPG